MHEATKQWHSPKCDISNRVFPNGIFLRTFLRLLVSFPRHFSDSCQNPTHFPIFQTCGHLVLNRCHRAGLHRNGLGILKRMQTVRLSGEQPERQDLHHNTRDKHSHTRTTSFCAHVDEKSSWNIHLDKTLHCLREVENEQGVV